MQGRLIWRLTNEPINDNEGIMMEYGPEHMRKYIVSTCKTWGRGRNGLRWNNAGDVLDARLKYTEGTHTLCQGRDKNTLILYCIPNRIKRPHNNWFANAGLENLED